MSSLFTRMATAVIDELEPYERMLVDPKVFARILAICSSVASGPESSDMSTSVPTPPPMHFIKAGLIIPGDFIWRQDLAFDVVESVTHEQGEVAIVLTDGRSVQREDYEPIRVAVERGKAQLWNQERVLMDAETVKSLYSAYGAF